MKTLVSPYEPTLKWIALILSIAVWLALLVVTFGGALLYLLLFYISYLFAQSALIAHLRGSAVRITVTQMPDLHARIERCSQRLQIRAVPEAYLLHGNGIFNAFATRFLGRDFVVLFSDVVDALDAQPGAVDFYIGHELGHIKCGHLTLGPVLAPALILPWLGAGYARAREYTCDRHGLACCETADDAARGLAALAAGHERWHTLSLTEFADQARASGGFWMSFHELLSDYPWLSKRMAWLQALAQDTKPALPRRSAFAWLLALFVPRIPLAVGGGGLLVTIAIIGILAAIAIPAYQDYIVRSQVMEGSILAAQVEQVAEKYYRSKGKLPADNAEAGLQAPEELTGKYVAAVEIADGEIVVTYGGAANALIRGKTLAYKGEALPGGGGIRWNCAVDDTTLANKHLPAPCRK